MGAERFRGEGGGERPDGSEGWKEGKVTDRVTEDGEEGGESEGRGDVRKAKGDTLRLSVQIYRKQQNDVEENKMDMSEVEI